MVSGIQFPVRRFIKGKPFILAKHKVCRDRNGPPEYQRESWIEQEFDEDAGSLKYRAL
jgi:hypothetical protein